MDVRPIAEADIPEWVRALNTGFLRAPSVSDAEVADRGSYLIRERTLGAFDGGRCVATFRSFPQQLTVVGGEFVAADAISNVTVTATHRRRGLLTRMMNQDLTAARDRGDVVATLIAAEYPIYGRFGFGSAAPFAEWTVDVPRTGLDRRRPGPEAGRVDLVDPEDVRKFGPELHERYRRSQPGAINRDERWWQIWTGALRLDRHPWTEPFYAVYRAADGAVEGLLTYTIDDHWGDAKQPLNTATVTDLITVGPAAERALWHYLCSVDWVTTVKSGGRPTDDLLPDLLPDPRAARITTIADFLWVRILDVVRALEARTYDTTGALVLEVTDHDGLSAGRYLLETAPDGTSCERTTRPAELTLDVGTLSSLWLGGASALRWAALGRVEENVPGAAARAESLLRTPRVPFCVDGF